MDKKVASNVVLGVFLSIAFLAFLFILFSIGGGRGLFTKEYSIYGKFIDIKGLHYGSEVSLSGLRVGVVKSIKLDEKDNKTLVVEMAINRKYQDQIRKDSHATLKTQGVLGDKFIQISIGSLTEPILKPGDFIETELLADIMTKGGDLVEGISKQFKEGGELNSLIRHLNKVAQNLERITAAVKEEKGLANEIFYGKTGDKLAKSMTHIEGILRKVEKGDGTLGALINDPTVYEDIKRLLGGANRSAIVRYFMRSFMEAGGDKPEKKEPTPKK